MLAKKGTLEPAVYDMPEDLEYQIADLKLSSMGVAMDVLTSEQERYLNSWTEETD
jgi:adenosylhomocysteinase